MGGYIGNEPTTGHFPVDNFTSSGGSTYTLSKAPGSAGAIEVSVQGVLQPTTAYTVSGTTLTMAGVTSGVKIFVRHLGETLSLPTPADGSVTTTKLAVNAVDGTKIAMGSDAQGDILYHGASDYTRLAKGTAGQSLVMNSGATAPEWGIGGKLLQLAHTTAAFTSTAISTTNNTWTDTDVLITFTPVSTASKFIVSFGIGSAVNADADDGGYGYRIKKVQNSTTSYPSRLTDYTGSAIIHSRRYFYSSNVSSVNNWFEYDTFQGVDADAHTTASLTYTIQCAQLNLDNNLTIGNVGNAVPQMMVMEIAN